jgi:hypothetical protein
MTASEQALRRHLAEARFVSGELDMKWRSVALAWPYATFEVMAPKGDAFVLRLEVNDYPLRPPTGTFWDVAANAMLPHHLWPRGGRASQVFRTDWHNGVGLYMPCDYFTLANHAPDWPASMPSMLWRPEVGVTQYLRIVHDLLRDPELSYAARARDIVAVA